MRTDGALVDVIAARVGARLQGLHGALQGGALHHYDVLLTVLWGLACRPRITCVYMYINTTMKKNNAKTPSSHLTIVSIVYFQEKKWNLMLYG